VNAPGYQVIKIRNKEYFALKRHAKKNGMYLQFVVTEAIRLYLDALKKGSTR